MKLIRKITSITIALLFCCGAVLNAQSVYVVNNSGAITSYSLSQEGKLYFENDNLMIITNANSAAQAIPLANIKKVTFNNTSDVYDVYDVNGSEISIFPNPTTDNVYIAYAKDGDKTEIYTWNGILLSTKSYSIGNGVSLSEFPVGLYILRINGQSYKISKK